MAHYTRYHISEVLRDVCNRLKPLNIAVCIGKRPSATDQFQEMIVVSVPYELSDINICQTGTMQMEVMVRNKAGGSENIVRLNELSNKLANLFPISTPRYSAVEPRLLIKGDDGLGFSIWNIRCKFIINTTDSYK